MPKIAKTLSALDIKRLAHDGRKGLIKINAGGVPGLLLQITPGGGKSWLLRTLVGNRRREFGLGSWPTVGVAEARESAREIKAKIRDGVDPVEERYSKRVALGAAQKGPTFSTCVDRYLDAHGATFRSEKHRRQWRASLDSYAIPQIGELRVSAVTIEDVLAVLQPIWAVKTVTAARLRGRIESILTWAAVSGYRSGDAPNPARWKGNLQVALPSPSRVADVTHQPAVAIDEIADWFHSLSQRDGVSALALKFLALTAARSGEVRMAQWGEINLQTKLWIVPAVRMKARREHRVPLSDEALGVLKSLPGQREGLVFKAPKGGALSDMTLSACMRRMHESAVSENGRGWCDPISQRPAVPHGLRSSFRDWVGERTEYPRELAEIALAHQVGSEVERAYRRADMVERRRDLMKSWAKFLARHSNE